ncbi:MAG: class I SAM-dependent methyltransferase [Syntrophomonadaceae bacterium]
MKDQHQTLLYIAYNLTKQNQVITIDAMKQPLEWLTGDSTHLEKGMEWLTKNDYFVVNVNREYTLSDMGKKEAFQVDKTRAREDFNRIISCGIESTAYLDYCEEIYGYRLPLFNMMDKEQLDYLFNHIPISQSEEILDLGCGAGCILGSLVAKYSCRGIGIDHINEDIVRACSPQISFIEGNFDNLNDYDIKPGLTLAVDSLYFSVDLDNLIRLLHSISNNRLYLYYSQYIFGENRRDEALLQRDQTRLARSLQKNGILYRTLDYSANEQELYEKAIAVLPKYKGSMADCLYDKFWRENNSGREFYRKGMASRYLYIAGEL